MLRFFYLLRGYVMIRLTGFAPERFMNLCSNKGILLWDVNKCGQEYTMCIGLKEFRQIKSIVRKTGTRVAVLKRCGLPFFVPKMLARKCFLFGMILAIGFWIVSSFFVWDIRAEGNLCVTKDQLFAFLEENEIYRGMRKSSLDIESLEKQIRRQYPIVTWTSAKLEGTRLVIQIKENDMPDYERVQDGEAGNLSADFDGTIVSMIVREGVPQVKIGDSVERGTVLVEGKIPVMNEDATVREYLSVKADADIVAEHTRSFHDELKKSYLQKDYTGRIRKEAYIRFGSRQLKLPADSPFAVYDSVVRETRPEVFELLKIPLYFGEITHREYQNTQHYHTMEEAKGILSDNLTLFLETLVEKGVQIIEKDVKIEHDGTKWILDCNLCVRERIGILTEIPEENVGEAEEAPQ